MPLFKSVKKFLTQPACGCKKTRKQRKVIRKSYRKKKYGGYSYSSKGSSSQLKYSPKGNSSKAQRPHSFKAQRPLS